MNNKKIALQKLRELEISAASGLVKRKDTFYVIADDELSLTCFEENKLEETQIQLLPGVLPTEYKERKKIKPDWESLCLIPVTQGIKEGLLVVPSGSKENRTQGCFLSFKNDFLEKPKEVDFSKIYQVLSTQFSELNIEGCVVTKSKLILFQRGNGSLNQNAFVELDLSGVQQDILQSGIILETRIKKVTLLDLGQLRGNSLGFTDACAVDLDQIFFLAVAEHSPNTYDDGEYQGAVIGCLNHLGRISYLQELDCPAKPEGLWVELQAGQKNIYIVTDADNRNQAASLLKAIIK